MNVDTCLVGVKSTSEEEQGDGGEDLMGFGSVMKAWMGKAKVQSPNVDSASIILILIECVFFFGLVVLSMITVLRLRRSNRKKLKKMLKMTETSSSFPIPNFLPNTTNDYTFLLLTCLIFFGLTRIIQCLFIASLWYAKKERGTLIDILFGGEGESEYRMAQIFWFMYVVGLGPYFSTFSSIVFQWAEVVRHSTENVNSFLEPSKMKYKTQYIIINVIVYLVLIFSGALYFVPKDPPYLFIIAKTTSVSMVAVISWCISCFMFYYGFRIRSVLKRQWLIQTPTKKCIATSSSSTLPSDIRTSNTEDDEQETEAYSTSTISTVSLLHDMPQYYYQTNDSFSHVESSQEENTNNDLANGDHTEDDGQISNVKKNDSTSKLHTSQKDRSQVLNWMMVLTIFLGLTSVIHFLLGIAFLAMSGMPVIVKVVVWVVCELLPTYCILIFFMKKSNHEKITTVLQTVKYGARFSG